MIDAFLSRVYPGLVALLLVAWAALLAFNARALAALVRPLIGRRAACAACGLALAGLLLRTAVFRPRHQVYFDEFSHEGIAFNLALDGTLAETLADDFKGVRILRRSPWPCGYHVPLAALFKLLGYSERIPCALDVGASVLSILLAFLVGALLFEDERAGVWAAFLLTVLPLHVRFSGTSELTNFSGFWILAALLAFEAHSRARGFPLLALLVATLAYAVNVRLENVLLSALLFPALRGARRRASAPLAALAAFGALALPPVLIFFGNRHAGLRGYADSGAGMLMNLAGFLPRNALYLLRQPLVPVVLLPAAVYAAYRESTGRRRAAWLALLGGAYLAAYSLHANGFLGTGANERLALPTVLCLLLAAGRGLAALPALRPASLWRVVAAANIVILLNASEYAKQPLEPVDADWYLGVAARVPRDCFIIGYAAPMFLFEAGHPAAAPSVALDPGALRRLDGGGRRPVFLLEDGLWRSTPDVARSVEAALRRRYRLEPLQTVVEDGKEYGLVALIPKPGAGAGAP